jgi:hypothetical protein
MEKLDSDSTYCKDFLQIPHPEERSVVEKAKNWEDVKSYTLDPEDEQELFDAQIECTLIWSGKEGWPMGVIVNPRVSIAITSKGSRVIERRSITYKCRATVHTDRETLDWVLPEFANAMRPGEPEKAEAFRQMLDSPGRVVFELVPETRIGFDSAKMWKASEAARPSDSPSAAH